MKGRERAAVVTSESAWSSIDRNRRSYRGISVSMDATETNILEIFTVVLLINRTVCVLMGKVFKDKGNVVGIKQQLGEILIFEDVC